MEQPSPADFNQKLRCLRDRLGLSQAAVAEHLGISQPAYHRLECKSDPPRLERLRQIADFYGVSFVELLERPAEELLRRVQAVHGSEHRPIFTSE
jgi:transcriptional regulator with XRE-family HTH domain